MEAGRLRLVSASPEDAEQLAPHLSPVDLIEIGALGKTPLGALMGPFELGRSYDTVSLIRADGMVIGMGGVFPVGIGSGAIWYLGRDEIVEDARDAVALARRYLAEVRKRYSMLFNAAYANSSRRLRLIRNMGFDFDQSVVQYSGIGFRHFCWKSDGPKRDAGPV